MINLFTMPMMIVSGIFFSYQNFQEWIISFTENLPLTMMVDSFREVINEEAGIKKGMENVLILSVGGVITFFMGLKMYRWF